MRIQGTLSDGRFAPLLLFVAAFCVRMAYLLLDYPVPPQDTADYDEIALNLLAGEGFVSRLTWFGYEMRSWRPPFYPFFLALVYGVWGYSHLAVKVVQALIGAGTVVLVWALACTLCRRAALLAGGLALCYGPLVAIPAEVMSETFFCFWIALAAWLLVVAEGRRNYLLLAGVVVGLAALTRPVGLLWGPAFAIVTVWRLRGVGVRQCIWVGVAVLLVVLPWSARNWQVHGAWVPISTHGGFILARSNAFDPAWRQERGWGIAESFFHRFPSEIERDRHWYAQGKTFILENPGYYLRLVVERFIRMWYFFRPDYNLWFMILMPFALLGLRRYCFAGNFAYLGSFVVCSTLVFSAILYGSTRFRLPLEPFFILFGAAYISDAWHDWDRRRLLAILGVVVIANLLIWWQQEPLRQLVLSGLNFFELQ